MNHIIPDIFAWMLRGKMRIFTKPGEHNIIYIEGMNPDGSLNKDELDGWNDLRLVITHDADGQPVITHCAVATTEPGRSATFSPAARRRGGVFRIMFGQHALCWRVGAHKSPDHPALVQAASIKGHRDANRDGIRPGDNISFGAGINQHGTRAGFDGENVGNFSEGCLVGKDWEEHIEFMQLITQDPRYLKNRQFRFTTTIIPGNLMMKNPNAPQ